jgi:hypothetical protein
VTRHWLRLDPSPREQAMAAGFALGAALGVGAVVFYFTRLFLAREEMEPVREREPAGALPSPRARDASPPPPGR